ncbi:MAG: hypothetical protein Q8M03_16630 [Legionella sp.]|nr:hypothetical protein [Legionella sp.]
MKKIFYITALVIPLYSFANEHPASLEGKYECAGHEVGTKSAFTCEMLIKRTGETYASEAKCSDSNSYRGTGIYSTATHHLSTVFINPQKSEETGVSVALVKKDGSLDTVWTYLNNTSIAKSICSKRG